MALWGAGISVGLFEESGDHCFRCASLVDSDVVKELGGMQIDGSTHLYSSTLEAEASAAGLHRGIPGQATYRDLFSKKLVKTSERNLPMCLLLLPLFSNLR